MSEDIIMLCYVMLCYVLYVYKGKGPKAECGSYSTITLLLVPGKVFVHVLLAGLQPLSKNPSSSVWIYKVITIDSWCNPRKLWAWRHNMPPPLSSPRGRPRALRAAELTQRSSTFPRRIRSHSDAAAALRVEAALRKAAW